VLFRSIATCAEMFDVWLHLIGPLLAVSDIVALSMVSKWGHTTAHNMTKHHGFGEVLGIDVCRQVAIDWPHIELKLKLESWSEKRVDREGSCDEGEGWELMECVKLKSVVCMDMRQCEVSRFDLIEPRVLREFSFHCPEPLLSKSACVSLGHMLLSCKFLSSLTLKRCVDRDTDVQWLVHALGQLTHLSHLDLEDNHLGPERTKQISFVLCDTSQTTSLQLKYKDSPAPAKTAYFTELTHLNLRGNDIGLGGARYLATAIASMHRLSWLNLFGNWMAEGVRELLPSFTHLTHLTHLNLKWNGVENETKNELRMRLPHVTNLKI